jgi:serine/threonine-protein kinase RsbW
MGILGQAVTNHTFSQQAAHKLGLKDIAVLLGYLPTSMEFKGVGDALSQRVSVVVHFMYLHKPTAITIFPPTHHRELVAALYRSLGVVPTVEMPESHEAVLPDVDSSLKVDIITSLSVAHIAIRTYGRNVVEEVRARVRYLCLQKIELISLYLDLLDPLTLHLTGEFEKQGFFFAGILPGATPKGDALILQYLNNVPIDYGKIKVASAQEKDLLAYIERTDPNRI